MKKTEWTATTVEHFSIYGLSRFRTTILLFNFNCIDSEWFMSDEKNVAIYGSSTAAGHGYVPRVSDRVHALSWAERRLFWKDWRTFGQFNYIIKCTRNPFGLTCDHLSRDEEDRKKGAFTTGNRNWLQLTYYYYAINAIRWKRSGGRSLIRFIKVLPKINNSFLPISTRIHCRVVRRDKEQDNQHLLTGLPPNDTGLQGPGGETLRGH